MHLHAGLNTKELLHKLRRDLDVEEKWKPLTLPLGVGSVISIEDRNSTARWLLAVNTAFGFYPETYVSSVSLMDTFINSVKVNTRYVRCIGLACLFIAAKLHQRDEKVPSASELVAGTGCSFSSADLRRMELVVLDKLDWAPRHVTALTFLHIFHALLLRSSTDMSSSARALSPRDPCGAGRLLQALLNLTASSLATQFSPCSLALALLSLQAAAWQPRAWLGPMLGLVSLTKKSHRQLAECREVVARQPWLHFISRPPMMTLKMNSLDNQNALLQRTPKRKAIDDDVDDDVYECIKRMYSDEKSSACTTRQDRLVFQSDVTRVKA